MEIKRKDVIAALPNAEEKARRDRAANETPVAGSNETQRERRSKPTGVAPESAKKSRRKVKIVL